MKKQKNKIFGEILDRFNLSNKNHDELMKRMQSRTSESDQNRQSFKPTESSLQKTKSLFQDLSEREHSVLTKQNDYRINDYESNNRNDNSMDSDNSMGIENKNVIVYNDAQQHDFKKMEIRNQKLREEYGFLKNKYDELYMDYDELCNKHDDLRKILTETSNINIELENTKIKLENKIQRDKNRLDHCKKTIYENNDLIKEFQQNIEKHENEYHSTIDQFKHKIEQLKIENEKLKIENKKKTNHNVVLQNKIQTLIENKNVLKEMNDALMKTNKSELSNNHSFSNYYNHMEKQKEQIEKSIHDKMDRWFENDNIANKLDHLSHHEQTKLLVNKLTNIKQKIQTIDENSKQKIDQELSSIRMRYDDFSEDIKKLEKFVKDNMKTISEEKWKSDVEPKINSKIQNLKKYFGDLMCSIEKEWEIDNQPKQNNLKQEKDNVIVLKDSLHEDENK